MNPSRPRLSLLLVAAVLASCAGCIKRSIGVRSDPPGALVLLDGAQSVPHQPIDVRALDCDFLVCSPYKFFGPHLGALYGKREHLARLRPYKVRPASDEGPERWETGTLNHEALAGLVAGSRSLLRDCADWQRQR